MKVKNDHRSKFSSLSNWKETWEKQGFNGIRTRDLRDTGAMLHQLSYEATHWERGQFIDSYLPWGVSEMMWSVYEIIDIWTAVVDDVAMCGFIARLVEHRTGIRGGHGFESRWALIFSGFFFPIV